MTRWQVFGGPHDGTTLNANTNQTIADELRQRGLTGTIILRQTSTGTTAIYLIRTQQEQPHD